MFIKFLMTTLLAASSGQAAIFQKQSHRIRIPVRELSCEEEALRLSKRFQNQSKIENTEFVCSGLTNVGVKNDIAPFYILDMSYIPSRASDLSILQSTFYGYTFYDSYNNDASGFYKSLRECLKDLKYRTSEFEFYANMDSLFSTCQRATSLDEISYVIRIDTVGVPTRRLFVIEDMGDKKMPDLIESAVEKILKAHGGHIVSHKGGLFYYYSKEKIELQSRDFGDMSEMACHAQKKDLIKILHQADKEELTIACTHRFYHEKGLVSLHAFWNHFISSSSYLTHEIYPTFEECSADKERVLQVERSHGSDVQTAICRLNSDGYQEEQKYYRLDLY